MARFDNIRFNIKPHWNAPGLAWGKRLSIINSADESMAWFFQTQEPDIISGLGCHFSSVSGSPGSYRLSLRNILGNGNPSTSVITAVAFTPISAWNGTFQWFDLDAPLEVGRGQYICMVLEHLSGAAGDVRIWRGIQGDSGIRKRGFPYFSFSSSAGATTRFGEFPVWGYRSAIRTYGLPLQDLEAGNVQSPAQRGMRIFLNSGWGLTFTLRGVRFQGRLADRSGRNTDIVVYQGTSELYRTSFSGDVPPLHGQDGMYDLLFTKAVLDQLEFGTEYFVVFEPKEPDTNFSLRTLVLPSTVEMTALPGSSPFYLVDRPLAVGDWVLSKNKRPMVNLLIDDWSKE